MTARGGECGVCETIVGGEGLLLDAIIVEATARSTCCAGAGITGANEVAPYESIASKFPHLGQVLTVSATRLAQRGHCTAQIVSRRAGLDPCPDLDPVTAGVANVEAPPTGRRVGVGDDLDARVAHRLLGRRQILDAKTDVPLA